MTRIAIDPITRLEGHGRIEVFLDDDGEVREAYFVVPELRGFEAFCRGRMAEDMPGLTNRICGICPEAHHVAATKALDALYGAPPSPRVKRLRSLFYAAFVVTDHATHSYALGGPDLLLGPGADRRERNLLGVVRALGPTMGGAILACRKRNHRLIEALGGRGVHPAAGMPGGWSRAIDEATRLEALETARANVAFAEATIALWHERVLGVPALRDLVLGDDLVLRACAVGLVDDANQSSIDDGVVRVIDADGAEILRYAPRDYAQHVAEHVEPWTYLKVPYLRARGFPGLVEDPASGLYTSTPLARMNVADRLSTPLADAELARLRAAFGGGLGPTGRPRPVHHLMATHWARLVELLHHSERMVELASDADLVGPVRRVLDGRVDPAGGVGCVEAPRGLLTHDYQADERGRLTRVNLVVGTTNNTAAMALAVTRAARGVIGRGRPITDEAMNRIEMGFRLFDPCLSCATHALPGAAPLAVTVRAASGEIVARAVRGSP